MRKLAESRLMTDSNSKQTISLVMQILTIALLIAWLSIILPIRQSQLERYPFQDGTYSLRSVSNENGQYDITLVLAEGTGITEAKNASVSENSDYEPEAHTEDGITYISLQPGERYELHSEERYHMTLSESEVQVQPADDGTKRVEKKSSILGTRYTLYM